ncbi:MAG: hypothetical protein AVDCRST_MAG64-1841, partial [uncultured Phycisphaerae bacterium]
CGTLRGMMDLTPRDPDDLARLDALIAAEREAKQRDRLRAVRLSLGGREAADVAAAVGRSRTFVQTWAYRYRDGGLGAIAPRKQPGRAAKLTAGRPSSRPSSGRPCGRGSWPARPRPTAARARSAARTSAGSSTASSARPTRCRPCTTCSGGSGCPRCGRGPGTARTTRPRPARGWPPPPFCRRRTRPPARGAGRGLVPGRGPGRPAGDA